MQKEPVQFSGPEKRQKGEARSQMDIFSFYFIFRERESKGKKER